MDQILWKLNLSVQSSSNHEQAFLIGVYLTWC